jgi:hypothetical protein
MDRHYEIATAVAARLAAGSYSLTPVGLPAVRATATFALEAVRSLVVDVTIGPATSVRLNRRGDMDSTYRVDVHVQCKLNTTASDELADLLTFASEIETDLRSAVISGLVARSVDREQPYDIALAEANGQFVATLNATYRELTHG